MTIPLNRPDETPLEIGATFAGYRIEELAGRQRGIGRVYVATHLESERRLEFPPWPVALKVFSPPAREAAEFGHRFEEMARRQAEMHDPSVVSIYEVGSAPAPFISMTLFRGPNLADLIASGELEDSSVLAILRSAAAGLEAGYEHQLVFRRLRPSCVLVASDADRAFLGDFGAGRSPKSTELMENEDLGTFVDYISPEEVRGAEPRRASNVYSLAAIAFECLTGETPFLRQHGPQALKTRLEEEPRRLGMLRPELPAGLESELKRALDPDPRRRHASPEAFVKAMTRAFPRKARKRRHAAAVSEVAGMPAIAATPPLGADRGQKRRRPRAVVRAATVRGRRRRGEPIEPPAASREEAAAPTSEETSTAARERALALAPPVEAAPERERAGRGRRVALGALLLVPLLVAAAVLGALAAPSDEPDRAATPTRGVASESLALRHPANWTRAGNEESIPGFELTNRVAVAAPAGARPGGRGVLVAGDFEPDQGQTLPTALVRLLPRTPEREAVDLGAVQAYRYRGLRPRGLDREISLYVVPTSGRPLVVGCLGAPGSSAFMAGCERVASTLRPTGETPVALAPSPSYARSLDRLVTRLNAARRSGRGRLARARTRGAQVDAANGLARTYRIVGRDAARLTTPPGARPAHAEIVRGLERSERAYLRMAGAARARQAERWGAAIGDVRTGEEGLQRGLRALRQLGYDPRPPS